MAKQSKLPPLPKPKAGAGRAPGSMPKPKSSASKTGSGNSKLGKIAPNVPGRKKSPSSNLPKTKEEERKEKRQQARQRRKERADKRATRSVKAASLAANIAAPGSGKIVKAVGNNPVAKKLISTSIRIKMVIGALVAAALVLVIIIPGFAMATFTSGLSLPQKMALDTVKTIHVNDNAAKAEELDILGSDVKDFSAMPIAASATMMDNPMQDGNGGTSDANLPDGDAGAVIEVAKHWIGVPYVWGGETPKGWDCSGFTRGVYRTALGLVIPHQSQAQRSKGKEVSYSEAKPGDLMVSSKHVMIFLGKGDGGKAYVIHSPREGGKVCIRLQPASYISQFQFYRMFNNTATADYIPSASEMTKDKGAEHPTYQLNAFDNWGISNGYFSQTSSKAYPKEAIAGTVPSEGATKTSFKGYLEVKPAVANFATSLIPFSPSPSPSQSETPDQAPDLKESEAPTPSDSDSAADTSNALSASEGTGQILGPGVGPMHLKEGVLDEEKAKSLSTSNRFLSCVVDKIAGTGTDPFRFAAGWKKTDRDRKIVDQDEYDKAKKTGSKIMQMLPLDGMDESKAGRLFDKASKWYNGKQVSEACEEDQVVTSTEQEQAGVGGQTTPTEGDAIKVTGPDGKEKTLSGEEYAFVSEVASKVGGTDMGVDQRVGAIEWAILHTNAKDKVDGTLEKIKSDWDDGKSIGENVYKAAGDLSAEDYDGQEAPARQLAGSGATALTKCGPGGGDGCASGEFNKDQPLDDKAVYGGPGMSQEQIQTFLEQKGSWLAKNKVDTNTKAPDQFCKGYESSGQELPSEIIYKTAKSCDVKAQWIMVRLQAEQGLITKKNQGNLRSAMGYGCPDGQKCAAEYYGFFNQVWWGSRQVQVYKKGKYKDSLPIGQQQTDLEGIPYTPKNDAARVLYLYTPHTSAAKDTFTIYKDYFPCSAVDEMGSASGAISSKTPAKAIPWVKEAYEGSGRRLPANFFAGMMYYESDFTPNIRNSLGYMGLCQIGTEEWKHLTGGTPNSPSIYDPMIHAKNCGKLSAENLDKVLKARASNLPSNLKSMPDWQLVILAHNAGPAYLTPQKGGRIPNETRAAIKRMMVYMGDAGTTKNASVSSDGAQNTPFKGYFEAAPAIGKKSPDGGFEATPVDNEYDWDGKFSKPYTGPNPQVTSPYGMRNHPTKGKYLKHNGVDLHSPEGAPQYATAPGVVEFAKSYGGCGNAVKIKHGEHAGHQWSTMHCHLSRMDVKAGQQVKAGTQIGLTGHTGNVTGPHIHYEVQQDGVAVEPTQFIFNGKEATPQAGMSNDGGSEDGSNNGGLSSEEVKKAHDAWVACGGKVPESQDTDPSLAPIPGQQAATIQDPTTKNGKITPRMKKFYDEAEKAGFGSPPGGVGCWRSDDPYPWHPRGNACDYMYKIGSPAKGKDLEDGNKFVKWAQDNADRLDVFYLIWQGKIWNRSTGKWKVYDGYNGTALQNPTTGHFDHVHVNVYP